MFEYCQKRVLQRQQIEIGLETIVCLSPVSLKILQTTKMLQIYLSHPHEMIQYAQEK